MPSLLNSIEGLAMEFENPVIGTIEPPPANFPIWSYTPIPVRKDAIKIRAISVSAQALCCDNIGKASSNKSFIPCPITQISPPTQKELKSAGHACVLGIFALTYWL